MGDAAYPNGCTVGRNIGHGEIRDDFPWTHNKHTIRAGTSIRYDKMTYSVIAENAVVVRYSFNDLADFAKRRLDRRKCQSGKQLRAILP